MLARLGFTQCTFGVHAVKNLPAAKRGGRDLLRDVVFLDALPTSATGKVQKNRLRESF